MPTTGSNYRPTEAGYSLDVFIGANKKIATMTLIEGTESDIAFVYEDEWSANGFPLSPHLPLNGDISFRAVRNFLQNLLPEGRGLDELLSSTTVSKNSTFGLIRLMGEETAGALSFRQARQPANATAFRQVAESELIEKLKLNHSVGTSLTYWDGKTRLSVAGVQEKLNFLEVDDKFGFGEGLLCSNKIFKFETGRIPYIAVNELFTMILARNAGLDTPHVELRRFENARAFVIERFDRKYVESTNAHGEKVTQVLRRHVIDGCQATNLPPTYKYERQFGDSGDGIYLRDGVSFQKLFAVPTEAHSVYEVQLIRWMTFNLLVGNYDAHGKNISFFVDKKGLVLAPFYDLVSVEASIREIQRQQSRTKASKESDTSLDALKTSEYSRFYAMSIGDYDAGSAGNFEAPLTAFMLASFADEFGVSLARMQLIMDFMIQSTLAAIDESRKQALSNHLSNEEIAHIDLCISVVRESAERLREEVKQIVDMHFLL